MATRSLLTPMQEKVTIQVALGLSNQEIADVLHIDANTARNHVYNIMKDMGFSNRVQLARWWIKNFEN